MDGQWIGFLDWWRRISSTTSFPAWEDKKSSYKVPSVRCLRYFFNDFGVAAPSWAGQVYGGGLSPPVCRLLALAILNLSLLMEVEFQSAGGHWSYDTCRCDSTVVHSPEGENTQPTRLSSQKDSSLSMGLSLSSSLPSFYCSVWYLTLPQT
ncbi:hypothetical protein J6590_047005 [Homalodisca vitripennis]|nr:hypothetical protein J6590_047005 [Homalodisca vitripennis]